MTSFANINMKAGKTLFKNSPWVTQTFFGVDFNPNLTTEYSWVSSGIYVTEEATIDCSSLTNWHEVLVGLYKFENTSWSTQTNDMSIRRQKLVWWVRTEIFFFPFWNVTLWNWQWNYIYSYVGIDYDEIWTGWDYRVQWLQNGNALITSATYTMTNVNPRSTLRTAWYVRIDWDNIHYIDSSYNSSQWFEHIIANNWSATYVWTDKAWAMWMPTAASNQLAYVDANWYRRLTHYADTWKPSTYVWTGKAWYIWVSNGQNEYDWYAYLCYVWQDWYKYRIMNGTV